MFQSSRDAVVITNQDGRIIDCNQATFDLSCYTWEELENTLAQNLYADPQERDELVAQVLAKGFAQDVEIKLRRKDGSIATCLSSAAILPICGELAGREHHPGHLGTQAGGKGTGRAPGQPG